MVPGDTILSDIDLADAEPARERRRDGLLRDDGLGPVDAGGRRVARGLRLVHRRPRGIAAGDQFLLPRQGEIGVLHLCLAGQEIRLFGGIVDLEQRRALGDLLGGVEVDRAHDAADLRCDIDALNGPERADRGNLRNPAIRLSLGHRHGCGRGRHLADELLDHLRLEDELKIGETAHETRQDQQDEHKSGCTLQENGLLLGMRPSARRAGRV